MLINGEMLTQHLCFDNIFPILIKIVLFYKQEVPSWQQKFVKKESWKVFNRWIKLHFSKFVGVMMEIKYI